jgi:hypothetical protein
VTRPARTGAACALALVLLLPACGSDDPDGAAPTGPASSEPAAESSTSAPPDGSTSTSAPPEPVQTLTGAAFSGYVDVAQEVVAWRLPCTDPEIVPVPDAVTMGTAERFLLDDGSASTLRQVAVFATPDEAATAADALGSFAREQCEGEVESAPGVVMSTTTVETLDVGAQGLLVDSVAEDGAAATAIFRRGNAVALVHAGGSPEYPQGRTPAEDVRSGADDLFEQLCGYEQGAC